MLGIILRFVFIFAYSVGVFYFAVDGAGAGHGTALFFAPLFTWPLVLGAFVAVVYADRMPGKIAFLFCVGLHYLHMSFWLSDCFNGYCDQEELVQLWKFSKTFAMFGIGWYLLGQVILWFMFLRQTGLWARDAPSSTT